MVSPTSSFTIILPFAATKTKNTRKVTKLTPKQTSYCSRYLHSVLPRLWQILYFFCLSRGMFNRIERNEALHNLCSSPNIITVIEWWWWWYGRDMLTHTDRWDMGDQGKHGSIIIQCNFNRRWKWRQFNWLDSLVNTVMSSRVPQKANNFLTSFLRTTQIHGVKPS
jgi:hypothetical protein